MGGRLTGRSAGCRPGAMNVTPCGVGIGVGSGRRNGAPLSSISQRSSMALSSCTVLWQCSMNIPPQSRNCMRDGDAAARAQAIDVLAALLPRRHVARVCRCGRGSGPPRSGCGSGDPSRRRRFSGSRSRACRTSAPPRPGRSRRASMSPPSVLMPHGPTNAVIGSLLVCLAPSPELEDPRRAPPGSSTDPGSGSGRRAPGSRRAAAGLRTMRNSRNRPTQGSGDLPDSASASVRSFAGLLPSWCSARFTIQTLSARCCSGRSR